MNVDKLNKQSDWNNLDSSQSQLIFAWPLLLTRNSHGPSGYIWRFTFIKGFRDSADGFIFPYQYHCLIVNVTYVILSFIIYNNFSDIPNMNGFIMLRSFYLKTCIFYHCCFTFIQMFWLLTWSYDTVWITYLSTMCVLLFGSTWVLRLNKAM